LSSGTFYFVCVSSVTLVHLAKVIGWNEMPFGRDICVVPSNSILDRCPSSPLEVGDLGVGMMLPIALIILFIFFSFMNLEFAHFVPIFCLPC